MEKFYIVTNENFLKAIEEYKLNKKKTYDFVKEFLQKHGISGSVYCIRGNGRINIPFEERDKENIQLYVADCDENDKKFGKQLLKAVIFEECSLRKFRKGCKILKEFQNECIEKEIVINNRFPTEGNYFKELGMGGYSLTRFEFEGKYYLRIKTSRYHSITPKHEGFNEIKGSDFFKALEDSEKQQ